MTGSSGEKGTSVLERFTFHNLTSTKCESVRGAHTFFFSSMLSLYQSSVHLEKYPQE